MLPLPVILLYYTIYRSMDSIKDFYAKEFERYSGEKTLLKRRGRTFMTLEIVSFVAAVAFVVLYIVESVSSLVLLAALVSLCTYLIVRHYDVKNDRRIEWLTKKCIVYNRELCYLRGDFSVFDKATGLLTCHILILWTWMCSGAIPCSTVWTALLQHAVAMPWPRR